MKRWRVGIIGCGWAGEQHARAMKSMAERVEIRAVADANVVLAQKAAHAWDVPLWTDDYQTLLKTDLLDAVSICLPHPLHAASAIAALQAGLDVLIEKPLANTLAEADAMIAAADANHRILMVAENVRYDTTYRKAAEIIHSGELGDLFLVRVYREHELHQYMLDRPWWLREPSGGILYAGGVHDFEIVRMLAGEIEHVYALTGPKIFPEMVGDQNSVAIAGLYGGVMAMLVETFALKTPEPGVSGTAHGSKGSLWFGKDRLRLYTAPQDGHPELVQEIVVPHRDTFEVEVAHFLDCLTTRQEPITSGREERKPLAAVLAAYAALSQRRRVYLTELENG